MARKTNTELIQELLARVAVLEREGELLWRRLDALEATQVRLADALAALTARVAVLEERVNKVEKVLDDMRRERWIILGALIGSVLTFIANLVLFLLRK